MQLYLVRHGQTDWNIKKQLQGITNIPMNATGIVQAEAVRDRFRAQGIKFDICYASPLQRAQKTAQIIIDGSCEIITNDLIIERDFGELERMGIEPKSLGLDYYSRVLNINDYGIETIKSTLARSERFLEQVRSERQPEDVILVASHGAFLRALTATIVGYDDSTDFGQFRYDNCEVKKFII